MKWLSNRKFRTATDRALSKLNSEFDSDAKARTLALALAYSCHPDGEYGDDGDMDAMVNRIRDLPSTPCDQKTAAAFCKEWESGSLKTNDAFMRIWAYETDAFVIWLVDNVGA